MALIIIAILLILLLRWFFLDYNFWDVTLFLGKKGSGKTSLCAKLSQKYLKKGFNVYSNVELPGVLVFNPTDLIDFTPKEKSVLIIDEVSLIWDNRNWAKFDSGYTQWFRYSRQYKCKVYLFTQTWDVDVKIKGLVDNLVMMSRVGKITLLRPVIKNLGISTDDKGNGQLVDSFKFGSIFNWSFIYLPRYYGFFKSYNPPERGIIRATEFSYNELSSVYADTKKWLIYCIISAKDSFILRIKSIYFKLRNRIKEKITFKKP